jgi:hypothetical protein
MCKTHLTVNCMPVRFYFVLSPIEKSDVFVAILYQNNIVVYRPTAKRWLSKQQPFLDSGLVNTFLLLGSRFLIMQHLDYSSGRTFFFLRGLCRDVIGKGRQLIVSLYGSLQRENLSAWSWRISSVRSCCQGMSGEDTAYWKRLSRCCGDLWIVEISSGTVITCSSESCV